MKILYHMPSLYSIYAQRTIYNGFKNAFTDLGHDFFTLTDNDDMKEVIERVGPEIFITSSHFYYRKAINFEVLKKFRDKGLKVFTRIDFWDSPLQGWRINEAGGMKDNKTIIDLIKRGLLGDIYFNVVEQGDARMTGFKEVTGYDYVTIPLAADKIVLQSFFDKTFQSDLSFVGTYLPGKRNFFKNVISPLKERYVIKIYGQDWTLFDRLLGWVQKFGQLFNIPIIKSIRKPKLALGDEAIIYHSSVISFNVHEEYQKQFGGDCNERTFKIPLCGGFQITDDVSCIRKYFKEGEEIIIATTKKDWEEKIAYFIQNPEKRIPIIEAGRKKVLAEHTYHNRVQQIISLYENNS